MTGRLVLGEEEQPWESSPAPPEWPLTKPSEGRREAFVEWIEQQDPPSEADIRPVATEEEFEAYLATLPEIAAAELEAVLRGCAAHRAGRAGAWAGVAACLRGPSPSAHFLGIVADLIAAEALHNRGGAKPGALIAAEVRKRHEDYVAILSRSYPDRKHESYEERAYDIIATQVQREGEKYEAARKRVQNAKRRKPKVEDRAIDRAEQAAREARVRR